MDSTHFGLADSNNFYYYGYCPFSNLTELKTNRYLLAGNSKYSTSYHDSYPYSSVFPNVIDLYINNFELNSKTICPKVQKLELGKNATVDKSLSLTNLSDLKSITLEDPTATIDCPGFSNKQYLNTILYVPEGSLAAYQNAEGWKNFWDIREVPTSGISEVVTDADVHEIGRYNLQGQPVTDDYKGFVITRYSDGTTRKMINK